MRFPALVAKTPVRTLTKYTSLKSFYTKSNEGKSNKAPLSYDNAGVYTSIMQDAFLDYKNIYKDIWFLEADVDSKSKKLEKSTFNSKYTTPTD